MARNKYCKGARWFCSALDMHVVITDVLYDEDDQVEAFVADYYEKDGSVFRDMEVSAHALDCLTYADVVRLKVPSKIVKRLSWLK